jgi:hypothetical protein
MNTAVAERKADVPMVSEAAAFIQVIERAASNKDVDVAKLEKLLDMQERILAKNAEMAFNSAMAEMQAELPIITERGEIRVAGTLRSRYAKFEDINEEVKPVLKQHGFAMTFKVNTDTVCKVTGILVHRAGHREQTEIVLPYDISGSKNNVQAIGSSVSYGKRYVMEALLNLTSRGQDDDGKGTQGPAPDAEGKAKLEACGSLNALETAWKDLSKEQRKTLAGVKDQCKARIEEADRAAA